MKSTKYLKYAFGEIFLVVIGILIALSINNWNEENKNKDYELTMLTELKEAIEIDILNIEASLPYLEHIQSILIKLAEMKLNPLSAKDSLENFINQVSGYGTTLIINASPFEAIKSGGLDRIKNHEIRNTMSKLFGFTIPQAQDWINTIHRNELFKRNDIKSALFNSHLLSTNDKRIEIAVSITDPERVLNDPKFVDLIFTAQWPLPATLNLLSNIRDEMTALLHLIEKEID